MNDEPTVETTEEAKEAKKRKRWRFEGGVAIVRDVDGTESKYAIATLDPSIMQRLAYTGLVALLSRADDEVAAYAKVLSGDFATAKAPAEKVMSPWRLAIAMARVDARKKHPEPVTLEQAKAWAADLDNKIVKAYKTDVSVVKHYNKLATTPVDVALPSLAD